MKILLTILFFIFFLNFSFSTQQIFSTRPETSAPAEYATYNSISGAPSQQWLPLYQAEQPMPARGKITDLFVWISASPTSCHLGIQRNFVFTIIKNGLETALTCKISGSNTTCSFSQEIQFNLGDKIAIMANPSLSTPPCPAEVSYSVRFISSKPKTTMLLGGSHSATSSTTQQFISSHGKVYPTTQSFLVETLIPADGNIMSFFALLSNTPVTPSSTDFNVYKNDVVTSIGCTYAGGASAGFGGICNDYNSFERVSVVIGDRIVVAFKQSGTINPSTFSIGLVFEPNQDGNFIVATSTDQNVPNATDPIKYFYTSAGDGLFSVDENESETYITSDFNIVALSVKIQNPVGLANSLNFILRDDRVNTAVSCTISGVASTSCTDVDNVRILAQSTINYRIVPNYLLDPSIPVGNFKASFKAAKGVPDNNCLYTFGVGDYNLACGDFCTVTIPVDIDGNNLVINSSKGAGKIFLEADINGAKDIIVNPSCSLVGAQFANGEK